MPSALEVRKLPVTAITNIKELPEDKPSVDDISVHSFGNVQWKVVAHLTAEERHGAQHQLVTGRKHTRDLALLAILLDNVGTLGVVDDDAFADGFVVVIGPRSQAASSDQNVLGYVEDDELGDGRDGFLEMFGR